jgi:hypothetical protein
MNEIIWTKEQDRDLSEIYESETDLRAIKKALDNVYNVPQIRKRLSQLNLIKPPPATTMSNMTPGRHAAVSAKRVSNAKLASLKPFPKLNVAATKGIKENETTRADSQSPRRSSRRMSVLGGVNRTGNIYILIVIVVKGLAASFEKPVENPSIDVKEVLAVDELPAVENELPAAAEPTKVAPKSSKKTKPVPIKEIIEKINKSRSFPALAVEPAAPSPPVSNLGKRRRGDSPPGTFRSGMAPPAKSVYGAAYRPKYIPRGKRAPTPALSKKDAIIEPPRGSKYVFIRANDRRARTEGFNATPVEVAEPIALFNPAPAPVVDEEASDIESEEEEMIGAAEPSMFTAFMQKFYAAEGSAEEDAEEIQDDDYESEEDAESSASEESEEEDSDDEKGVVEAEGNWVTRAWSMVKFF